MKVKFSLLFVVALLLFSCEENQRAKQMRLLLSQTQAQNREGHVFDNDSIGQKLVAYFNRHGTANEQMHSYYLLGRSYSDMGDAPMALQCYQEAIEKADTLHPDCDYIGLARVYSQMAYVLEQQEVYHDAIKCCNIASHFALMAGDTVEAVLDYSLQVNSYDKMLMTDSVRSIALRSYSLFSKYGKSVLAARSLNHLIIDDIEKGNLQEAEHLMAIYERESGRFDSCGNYISAKGVYDYYRGLFFLKQSDYAKAEHYFRRLSSSEELNQRKAFYLGMRELYKKLHIPDSLAMYSELYTDANDTSYIQLSTHTMHRMQAMYNYGRATRESEKVAKEKARLAMFLFAFVLTVVMMSFVAFNAYRSLKARQRMRMLEMKRKYFKDIRELKQKRDDLSLRYQALEASNQQRFIEQEQEIAHLEAEISSYLAHHPEIPSLLNVELKDAPVTQIFVSHRKNNSLPTAEEWKALRQLIQQKIPGFFVILDETKYGISQTDIHICMLRRLGFQPKDIAVLTDTYEQKVTNTRARLLTRVFGQKEGGAKAFDAILMSIQ